MWSVFGHINKTPIRKKFCFFLSWFKLKLTKYFLFANFSYQFYVVSFIYKVIWFQSFFFPGEWWNSCYFCLLGFGTPAPTTTTTPSLFGTPQTVQTPAFGTPQGFPSAGGEQPFQLNKPPGSKRNKRWNSIWWETVM